MENFLNNILAQVIYFFSDQISVFTYNLKSLHVSIFQIAIDILAVAVLFYMLIRWVEGTRAKQMMMGIVLLGIIYAISVIFQFIAVKTLFQIFFPAFVIAIPVVFQQELRRGLEVLGQKGFFSRNKNKKQKDIINILTEAVKTIKLKKRGALIVLEKFVSLKDYIDTGVVLNAQLSIELLLNIFLSKAPLHDGAVIIRGDSIIAASCVLPFSEQIKSMEYGTRHKSALGLSELTDALIIVVSEEKNEISVADQGELFNRISTEKLASMISSFFKHNV